MYELLYLRKKTLWTIVLICLVVTTYLSVNIVISQVNNNLVLDENLKVIYTLTFITIILLNLFNFIYVKIILTLFQIKKSNLVNIFYSATLMCLMIIMNPINLNITIKLIIKILMFNLVFQGKKFKMDLFVLSLIIGIIDLLMTLLLLWR